MAAKYLSNLANHAKFSKLTRATPSSEIMALPSWFKNAKPKKAVTRLISLTSLISSAKLL
jgi:hypothetical protein